MKLFDFAKDFFFSSDEEDELNESAAYEEVYSMVKFCYFMLSIKSFVILFCVSIGLNGK